MILKLDTNDTLICDHCDQLIWPLEDKVIIGVDKNVYSFHKACEDAFFAQLAIKLAED